MYFSMPWRVSLGFMVLAGAFLLTGCTSHLPTPNIPGTPGPMILVDGESLPTISFDKVIADIPGGRITGYHYEGMEYTRGYAHKWDENFNNESSDFNTLAMQLLDDAGYRAQAAGHGKLRLEATIRKLTYNSYSNKTDFDQAECELRWNLFQARQKQPFFTMDTKGAGRVDSSKTGAIKAAFELGLRRLLESEDFAEAVKSQ